jgi:hypothetical protein
MKTKLLLILAVLLSGLAVTNLAKAQNVPSPDENCGLNSITSEGTLSSYSLIYLNCSNNSLTISETTGCNALQTLSCNDALSNLYLYRSETDPNTTFTNLSCGNNPEFTITSPQCCKKGGTTNKKHPKKPKPQPKQKPKPSGGTTIGDNEVPL